MNVAIYIRKSREDREETKESTLERHERILKEYCDNVDDFMSEFGYTDYDHAQCVYKQLQENNSRLEQVFTAEELRVLEEETADF